MGFPSHESLGYDELDRLTGEVLPDRMLMSVPALSMGDGGRGVTVFYACQATWSGGTPGLLGTGLLAQPPNSTMTCVPAVVQSS
jgi:hypothetical protein